MEIHSKVNKKWKSNHSIYKRNPRHDFKSYCRPSWVVLLSLLSVSFPWHCFFLSTQDPFGRPVLIRCKELTQLWSEPAHSDHNFPWLQFYWLHVTPSGISPDLIFEIHLLSLASVISVTTVRAPLAGCNFAPHQPCGQQNSMDELWISSQTLNMNNCLVL